MTNNNFMNNSENENSKKIPSDLIKQGPYSQAELNDLLQYRLTYPEIYYKCQPFVMMICDQMDTYSSEMPNQEMVEQMTDKAITDIYQMYPDIADYTNYSEQTVNYRNDDNTRDWNYGRRFRRRNPFKDFIEFLILSELFRRRRRY